MPCSAGLTHIAVETVLTFYSGRAAEQGRPGAKSGAVTAVQRTSSDLRLNPHLHLIVLDGVWREDAGDVRFLAARIEVKLGLPAVDPPAPHGS